MQIHHSFHRRNSGHWTYFLAWGISLTSEEEQFKPLTLPYQLILREIHINFNNVPLSIGNFEIDKLKAKTFKLKTSGNVTYFAIPFDYDEGDPFMKIVGNFRVFKHVNAGRVNYSLAVSIDDQNKEFFSELGQKIATLAWKTRAKP